jgi:hypothetical protein
MSTIAIHYAPGMIGIEARPHPLEDPPFWAALPRRTPRQPAADDAVEPPESPTRNAEETEPTEIYLGTLSVPPLPSGIVVIGDRSHSGQTPDRFQLRLDMAFRHGQFDPRMLRQIQGASARTPDSTPFEIDAQLPLHRLIDLDLLSRHVSGIGTQIGRMVVMRLAPEHSHD